MTLLAFRVRAAGPTDVPALMRFKRLLAESEDGLHTVRATAADWLRDASDPAGTAPWASAGHSDVETAVPRHGPKNRGSRRWPAFVLRPFLVRASDEEVAARCFSPPLHWIVNNAKIKTQ